jgi:hypothetical protein
MNDDDGRKPNRQSKISPEEQATYFALHSRDADVRVAAASSGNLSARMLEEALTRGKDVRHTVMTHQPLHASQVTYYLTKGSVEDRMLILENQQVEDYQLDLAVHHGSARVRVAVAKRPGLSSRATSELLMDERDSVALAAIEHQTIAPDDLDLTLRTSRGRELRALAQHQSLTTDWVEALLHDRDPLVRLATVQHQPLTTVQAGRLMDQYATSTNGTEREIRRAAVDRADPRRLQAAVNDPDPVVAENARQALDDVVAVMVAAVEADRDELRGGLRTADEEERWARSGQRELDWKAAREAQAAAREEGWWFDRAWEERTELLTQVGMRPADPQVSLAALVQDRDAAAKVATRWRQSAAMLPTGHRGILDQQVSDANAQHAGIAAAVAVMEAAISDGSHAQVLARAQWDVAHGTDADRIQELTSQCVEHLGELSRDDWSIAPVPTTDVAQALYIRLYGDYAAAHARIERTGVVAEVDVAARAAHHAMAADVGWQLSRGGYSEELLHSTSGPSYGV